MKPTESELLKSLSEMYASIYESPHTDEKQAKYDNELHKRLERRANPPAGAAANPSPKKGHRHSPDEVQAAREYREVQKGPDNAQPTPTKEKKKVIAKRPPVLRAVTNMVINGKPVAAGKAITPSMQKHLSASQIEAIRNKGKK
jgi:hypothetical protein